MDLPEVSLGPEPQPCRRPHPVTVTPPRIDARIDGGADGGADGTGDGADAPVLTLTMDRPPAGRNLPVPVLAPRRSLAGRCRLILAHWATRWWQAAAKAVANPRGPYHAQPESLAAHDAYRRSRAWVPPGHEGRFLGPAGAGYHLTFATFGMATGYGWAWLWARPLRITIAAVVLGGICLGFWLG
jgi:hypothetical protein